MSKQKFKVGDTVRIVEVNIPDAIGTIGELRNIDNDDIPYFVNGLWCRKVELVKRKKHPVIVITSDGKTTTATMREGKKVIKTATATCSDKGTFDYDEGARIAFERLQGRDPFAKEGKKPEYYNGKIVCIKSDVPPFWTPGKVYEIKDGWTKDNSGITPPRISSVDEINRELANYAKFIPLVED